jgi:hypothetical protein
MSRQNTGNRVPMQTPPAAPRTGTTSQAPARADIYGAPAIAPGGQSMEVKPNPDAVRRRAYELYMECTAKGKPGDDKSDWLQAERDLKR